MAGRAHLFDEPTNSICSRCLRKVGAKLVFERSAVFMLERCHEHGGERVLVSTDEAFYRQQRAPGAMSSSIRRAIA